MKNKGLSKIKMLSPLKLIVYVCFIQTLVAGQEWTTVYLASFPRSGNHWVRFLTEEATHIATSSAYRDRNYPHLKNVFPWGGYCTDHGYDGQCRFPEASDPVLIKTHYPFLPKQIQPQPERAICLIRHPIDAFWSFYVYKGGTEGTSIGKERLQDYMKRWRAFYEYWEAQPGVLIVRYEDLQEHPAEYLTSILRHAGFAFDETDVERAINKYSSQGYPLKHLICYDTESIEMIKSELTDLLTRYQYDL